MMQWILNNHRTIDNGYTGNRASPFAVGATIAVHIAVGGLVYILPPGTLPTLEPDILWIDPVPATKPPEDKVRPETKKNRPLQRAQQQDDRIEPDTPPLEPTGPTGETGEAGPGTGDTGTSAGTGPITHQPVLVSALPDPNRLRDFQPDYPPAMIRAQIEGFATVRVHISAAGRVETVELVDTNDSAFWKATREQALKRWRFRPATRDGVAVPSERVMTVRFRLSDL